MITGDLVLRRFLSPYSLCIMVGMAAGLAFGDRVFPVIGETFGDPLDDFILGFGGAFLAAVVYEMVIAGGRRL